MPPGSTHYTIYATRCPHVGSALSLPHCRRTVRAGARLRAVGQARVPLYVPYADFYQYQAGAGRLADRA